MPRVLKNLEKLIEQLKFELDPGQIEEAFIEYFPIENPHEDFRIIH